MQNHANINREWSLSALYQPGGADYTDQITTGTFGFSEPPTSYTKGLHLIPRPTLVQKIVKSFVIFLSFNFIYQELQ